jgi:hypothetical protein
MGLHSLELSPQGVQSLFCRTIDLQAQRPSIKCQCSGKSVIAVNCAKKWSTYTWGAAVPVQLNVRTFGCIGELTAGSALLKESD